MLRSIMQAQPLSPRTTELQSATSDVTSYFTPALAARARALVIAGPWSPEQIGMMLAQ